MTTFDRNTFDDLLEAYLDGATTAEESRALEAFASADEEAGEELRFARMVQQRLQTMPTPVCPPDVTKAVLATARAESRQSFLARIRRAARSSWSTVVRPSLVVGAFIAVVVGGALVGRAPVPEHTFASGEASPEEVEQALAEAKSAFALISDAGRRTATIIRDDVLDQRVVQPVNRALTTAFDDEAHVQ